MIIVHDESAREAALRLARGNYQRGILYGQNCLSGSDLKGKPNFARIYRRSVDGLLARMTAARIPWRVVRVGPTRVLVIGHPMLCFANAVAAVFELDAPPELVGPALAGDRDALAVLQDYCAERGIGGR